MIRKVKRFISIVKLRFYEKLYERLIDKASECAADARFDVSRRLIEEAYECLDKCVAIRIDLFA